MESAELLPDPHPAVYVFATVVTAGASIAAAVRYGAVPVVVALVVLVLLAAVTGWTWTRKGYSFVEGWFAGLVFFPLAVAFGVFGPPRTRESRPAAAGAVAERGGGS